MTCRLDQTRGKVTTMVSDSQNKFKTISILVPTPSPVPYTYSLPADQHAGPGSIVQVPLGPRQVSGLVVAITK